ncbi:EGF-like domain-containing protein [Tieghemostelium lacteum]|uniref:EGF-like domain-containing protein n=1 Tax=Tieghemostelium lacteum TaxID=361077 RepID=A0A151ZEU6_TIELA|nr:EGF-like domain-containing protein [Tieghemostelium lacteum]|eukprot:KYQ92430.1 EGF-like domain-containing protein [Tieghemostelium lacteum]
MVLIDGTIILDELVVVAPICVQIPHPLQAQEIFVAPTFQDSKNLQKYAATYGFNFNLQRSYSDILNVYCFPYVCSIAPYISPFLFVQVGIPNPIQLSELANTLEFIFAAVDGRNTSIEASTLMSTSTGNTYNFTSYPANNDNANYPSTITFTLSVPRSFETFISPFYAGNYGNNPSILFRKIYRDNDSQTFLGTRNVQGPTETCDVIVYPNFLPTVYSAQILYPTQSQYKSLIIQTTFTQNVISMTNPVYRLISLVGQNNAFEYLSPWDLTITVNGNTMVNKQVVPTPIGVISGTYNLAKVTLRYIISPHFAASLEINPLTTFNSMPDGPPSPDIIPPVLDSINFIPLQNCSVLVQIIAHDDKSGLHRFQLFNDYFIYASKSAVSPPLYSSDGYILSGKFEAIIESNGLPLTSLDVVGFDNAGNAGDWSFYPNLQKPFTRFPCTLPSSTFVPRNFFDKFFFTFNQINLTSPSSNTLYVNFTKPMDTNAKVYLTFDLQRNTMIPGFYYHEIKMWAIDFEVPMNPTGDKIFYTFTYPDISLTSEALLKVVGPSSQLVVNLITGDEEPPLMTSITEFSNGTHLGYEFTITDTINGLLKGEVKLQSDNDAQPYTFTFDPITMDKPIHSATYRALVPLSDFPACQTSPGYILMTYIRLEDRGGNVGVFNKGISTDDLGITTINPFYPQGAAMPEPLPFSCTTISDNVSPLITYFQDPNYNIVDVGGINRKFVYNFQGDDTNDISTRHIPYCRIYTLYDEFYVKAEMTINGNSYNGSCTTELPYAWAQGLMQSHGVFRVSVHGVSDIVFNIGGYENTGVVFNTVLDYVSTMIDGYYPFSTLGGSLTIKGHRFGLVTTSQVRVNITKGTQFQLYEPSFISGTLVIVDNLPPSTDTFLATVIITNIDPSNQLLIIPTPPRVNPLPTYPPVTQPPSCPGTPPCSGPSRGSCTSKGCECISPYRGNDCSSQTVPGGPPETGGNDPTTNSTTEIPTEGGGSITVTSLISVIALNELNFKGESVKNHSLSNWKLDNTSAVVGDVIATYSLTIDNDPIVKTNISVTIQYFIDETLIEFAGEELRMYPSSLKYSIDIGEYKFAQSLNTLQLIMSVGISTSDDEIGSCINQEIGNTTESDSEFYKLQINDHSLYGRFIKRGIVDNNIRALSSTIQTSIDDNSKSNSIQSLIAINIPHYSESVLIDPDFSILLDSQPAQDKDDSICTAKSDKGLSKSQLAGIIIGCVAFAVIVAISIAYVLYKRKQAIDLQKRINKINEFK